MNTLCLRLSPALVGAFLGATLLATAVRAQSDACSAPTVIAGAGPHAFDTTLATTGTEGQSESACLFFGTTGIATDMWFSWTAGASGPVLVSLCGFVGLDTKIAAYAGMGCPTGPALACNDDACGGLESEICFAVFAGSTYTLQIGNFPGATPGPGSFTISPTGPCCGSMGVVPAGSDLLHTPDGGCSYHSFGNVPIPAGFFGSGSGGSLPYVNSIFFKGAALNGTGIPTGTDTIIERLAPANLGACPSTATIPIVMRALSLRSAIDINVFFAGGGFETYRVEACLTNAVAQPTGSMTITRAYQNGGTFTSSLPVVAKFTFIRTSVDTHGSLASAVLDQGTLGQSITLSAPGVGTPPTSWVYSAPAPSSPGGFVDHDCSSSPQIPFPPSTNFFVGFVQPGATCSTPCGPVVKQMSREDALFAQHCFLPVYMLPVEGPYCLCQGNHAPTPCLNAGGLGRGCENSLGTGGGLLSVSGTAQVVGDNVTLMGSGLVGTTCLFYQGTGAVESPFGDGLRCVGGAQSRLGIQLIGSGEATYPASGDLPVSVKGMIPPFGGQRFYQIWYRNVAAGFCTPASFNLSNGYQLVWVP